ncbi:hypothetical protein Ahy_B01g053420 isoform B [Arachis hypogaea]|uniref:Uncharacterized protein n=1 Tax=Arachis hypogaea TaxID=3818 RepID=A0A445ARP7_ARAHY|nr:hypothetical protein Ahy_B01g053420 isoform B [Arachis hypogaea]
MRGLKHVLELINQDSSTNVAIVTSSVPGVYCTGADLKERKAFIAFEVREYSKALCAIFSFLKKFLEHDFLLEKLSHVASIYVINEESEPSFFIRFFKWDSGKPVMLGNSFQRKLTIGCCTSRCTWNSIGIRHKKVVSFDNFMSHCGLVANEPISDVGLMNNDDDDSASSENGILINKKNLYDSDTLL